MFDVTQNIFSYCNIQCKINDSCQYQTQREYPELVNKITKDWHSQCGKMLILLSFQLFDNDCVVLFLWEANFSQIF